jgi:hypothetical protein
VVRVGGKSGAEADQPAAKSQLTNQRRERKEPPQRTLKRSNLSFSATSARIVSASSALIIFVKSKSIDKPRDAVFQAINVEIDQQAQPLSSKPEIREKLGLVNRQNSFDVLKFDDNFILDEKIERITKVNAHSIVGHGQRKLRFDAQPRFRNS